MRGSAFQTEKPKQNQPIVSFPSVNLEDESSKSLSTNEVAGDSDSKLSLKQASELSSNMLETPVKCISAKDAILNTPVEMASTPAKLMSATPMLRPPKRCPMSPDDISFSTPSKLVRRPPTSRPLRFDTPVKSVKADDEYGLSGNSSSHDDILSGALLQSVSSIL